MSDLLWWGRGEGCILCCGAEGSAVVTYGMALGRGPHVRTGPVSRIGDDRGRIAGKGVQR